MAVLYLAAGIAHFAYPKAYMRIMPRYIPAHKFLVLVSGAIEIILAIGLVVPSLTKLAAWGIIALLFAVFPANIHHFNTTTTTSTWVKWLLFLRLPLQGALMYWAYLFT